MAQIDVYNRERGVIYVYESVSYWNKELKQPRSKRKLIGKRDAKGNIIPTGPRGRWCTGLSEHNVISQYCPQREHRSV